MAEIVTTVFTDGSIFRGLDPSLRNALLAKGATTVMKSGQILFMEEDESNGFYIVRSGGLKATRLSAEGDEQMLAVFSTGDSIGEMAMFDDRPRSATITALCESSVTHWPSGTFFGFADDNGALYRHLLAVLAKRLRDTNDALAARDFLPLTGQLARIMLRLGTGLGKEQANGSILITHRLTQSELASMIGASRENVSRVLNDWKRKGIIARDGRYYRLIDLDALEQLSEGWRPGDSQA